MARIDALEAKIDAVLTGLAAQTANLSQSAQDAQPHVCIHTGIDPSVFLISDASTEAALDETSLSAADGLDASTSAGCQRLAAFAVYYDETSKSLKMVEPLVIINGKEVKCDTPDNISTNLLYYCHIRRGSTNSYNCAVESASSNSNIVCSVKLFLASYDSVTQYHMGAIILNLSNEITICGNDDTSATCTSGKINFISDDESNVKITAKEESSGDVTVKIGVRYL